MAFFNNVSFPFFTMQELNLDWLLNEVKRIAGFMPQGGNIGDILTRKASGAAWEPPEAVNININALPEDTEIGDNDQLIFYDISAQANRKIKPPNLLDSMMSNATPLMDGTGSAGTSKKPARYDHKHPTDTSRAPASYFQNDQLKVANGGTGAGTAAAARTNLGLGDIATEDIAPITKGGTGADNAGDACNNLGLFTAYKTQQISIGDVSTLKTLAISNITFGGAILVVDGTSLARTGMYIIGFRRTAQCVVEPIVASTDLTITANVGNITVKSSESNTFGFLIPLGTSLVDNLTVT